MVAKQFTGVAGVAADRLARAFGLGDSAADVATVFELHPAFHPRTYVDWSVELDGDVEFVRDNLIHGVRKMPLALA